MIPIRNVFYMLAYAYRFLHAGNYRRMAVDSFASVADLYAGILIEGMRGQLKRGLLHRYQDEKKVLQAPIGKTHFRESLTLLRTQEKALVCEVDDFTPDCPENRLIKTTLQLLRHSDIAPERQHEIDRLLHFLTPVGTLDLSDSAGWRRIATVRGERHDTYRQLLAICVLLLEDLLISTASGEHRLRDYTDEQKLSHLYEKFLLAFFQKHYPGLRPRVELLSWLSGQEAAVRESDFAALLPGMQTDIVMSDAHRVLVMDAKYYTHPLRVYRGRAQLHSAHVYQLYAYMATLAKKYPGREVAGLLLYAQSEDAVVIDGHIPMPGGYTLGAKVIDLAAPFEAIEAGLHQVVAEYFAVSTPVAMATQVAPATTAVAAVPPAHGD